MKGHFRALFLFTSFAPLYLLIGVVLGVKCQWGGASIWLAIFLLSVLVYAVLIRHLKRASQIHKSVVSAERLDSDILSYVVSYLPPLISQDLDSVVTYIPLFVFYITVLTLLFHSRNLYVNPLFMLAGFSVFRVDVGLSRPVVVITRKKDLFPQDGIALYEVQTSVLYFGE